MLGAVDFGEAERLADDVVEAGEAPGIVIGVDERGRGRRFIARGLADLRSGGRMRAENAQRIGRITKSFTVTRLLQLVDEGRVSMDDPIRRCGLGLRNGGARRAKLGFDGGDGIRIAGDAAAGL